jgi:hypothetical protein
MIYPKIAETMSYMSSMHNMLNMLKILTFFTNINHRDACLRLALVGRTRGESLSFSVSMPAAGRGVAVTCAGAAPPTRQQRLQHRGRLLLGRSPSDQTHLSLF